MACAFGWHGMTGRMRCLGCTDLVAEAGAYTAESTLDSIVIPVPQKRLGDIVVECKVRARCLALRMTQGGHMGQQHADVRV
jgi:hypothetical protein